MVEMKRREFFTATAAMAVAGACACGLEGCATFTKVGDTPPIPAGAYIIERGRVRIALDQAPELAKDGGSVKIIDPGLPEPLIVAHAPDGTYVAASLLCPQGGDRVPAQAARVPLRQPGPQHLPPQRDPDQGPGQEAAHELRRPGPAP
jgi:hypothetical protein